MTTPDTTNSAVLLKMGGVGTVTPPKATTEPPEQPDTPSESK